MTIVLGISVPVNNLVYNLILRDGALVEGVDLSFPTSCLHRRDRGAGADFGDDPIASSRRCITRSASSCRSSP